MIASSSSASSNTPKPIATTSGWAPSWPSSIASPAAAHTLFYLQRRAWRYFRRMGFQRPAEYPAAVAKGLARYRDMDLPDGLAVLDSWGLIHACFGEGDAVHFNTAHA